MPARHAQRQTIDIPVFARWLGISPATAYRAANADGAIAGVPVIRVGTRLFVRRRDAVALLGYDPEQPSEQSVTVVSA